jgi:hypothetical protein
MCADYSPSLQPIGNTIFVIMAFDNRSLAMH